MPIRQGNKHKEFPAIKEPTGDWDKIEREIILAIKREIFAPIIKALREKNLFVKLQNANDALSWAIHNGSVQFKDGEFRGKFTSEISKELKELGAHWNRKSATWGIELRRLPMAVRSAIGMSQVRFEEKLSAIDQAIQNIDPDSITDQLKLSEIFDTALWKVEKQYRKNVSKITVPPVFTKERREVIAYKWSENLKRDIKGWTDKQLLQFRKDIRKSIYAGQRHEALAKIIQDRYNVSKNKAKFWARQETKLAMTSYAESRYLEAGVDWYKWRTVHDSKVRHSHKDLDGRAFKFSDPPVTTNVGERPRFNNPGQDYNCRCMAIPLVGYKGEWGEKVK